MKNRSGSRSLAGRIKENWQLYAILLIPLIYIIIFKYLPMYGAQIAFKDFRIREGIWGSDWVGFKYFIRFFKSPMFGRVLKNTLEISFMKLFISFPFPIILALSLNYVRSQRFGKFSQLVTYAPHFISEVVLVGFVIQLLSPRLGVVNKVINSLGFESVNFLGTPEFFSSIYVWSDIWQHTGFASVIYIAALSAVDPQLYEAAIVDGANKFQRIIHIDLACLMPTIVTLLILNTGHIMNLAFQKVLILQNSLNIPASEIIQTYVYKIGFASTAPNYSFASAIGLFNSVVNFILLLIVNKISRKVTNTSLW